MREVLGILHVVSNLEKMAHFFTEVLEFEEIRRSEWEGESFEKLFQLPKSKGKLVKLKLGNEFHYLLEFSPGHGRPYPEDSRSHDLGFQHIAIVVSDMEMAHAKLMKHGVKHISTFPQTIPEWNEPAAGIKAFYFRSPDGHPLEIIYFPPGKGNPIWQNPSSLFLGVDHTAIGVSKTEASLKFYHDLLGMQVVGGSLNYGETQEKLSGVPGARVKITTVRFPNSKGMGIEFLEYLHPIDGRKKPPSTKAHHLTEIETIIAVDDLSSLLEKTKRFNTPILSQGMILQKGSEEFKKMGMIADPDGYRILVVEMQGKK